MKAQDLPFTQLLEGSKQFIIPIFQRTYSWEVPQCQQLWDDIVRVGTHTELKSHFVGSAVYIPEENTNAAISRWLVIDGQQRITTLTLLLLAFRRRLKEESLSDPVTAEYIDDQFLKNRHGAGELSYKIALTQTDRDTMFALLDGKQPPEPASERILENFEFFVQRLADADLTTLFQGIRKLMVVDVCLQQGIDNPQMIFESMNSTGKALTQADLIRNFVLMGEEHALQTRLYQDYWRPMEREFGAENYVRAFDEFMRFFLVVHLRDPRIRKTDVYDEFKRFSRQHEVEPLLALLKQFSSYYCAIALVSEKSQKLADVFHDIRELRADVCYPMLMEIYRDFEESRLTSVEFVEIARLVESYVFRRAVCDIPTNSLRQTFATFMKDVDKANYLESVKAKFLLLSSYRRFPGDDEFSRQIQVRNLYKWNRRSYWLRRFENHGRKERVYVNDYTIEHIMPQNENLSAEWRADLGDDWQDVQQKYLHTLGNLTLTGYNSEYSDRPFAEKRDRQGGFKSSPLKLNEGLGSCLRWEEGSIRQRAAKLAAEAVEVWRASELSDEILEKYRPSKAVDSEYSIEDHPQLEDGISRQLFDSLSAEIMALDECVIREFKKLYIAFKAETNFVDVIPQAERLRLTLNIGFPEVDDPRGICTDITGVGRWGNGDVSVFLEREEDLPYIVGLIRQALDRQLGDQDETAE